MKIEIISLTEEGQERRDYRNILMIKVDGKQVFEVFDGEPEDANLARDFSDCWNIPKMLKAAHKAGLAGEKLEMERSEEDEI